jgi:hypothetical protein
MQVGGGNADVHAEDMHALFDEAHQDQKDDEERLAKQPLIKRVLTMGAADATTKKDETWTGAQRYASGTFSRGGFAQASRPQGQAAAADQGLGLSRRQVGSRGQATAEENNTAPTIGGGGGGGAAGGDAAAAAVTMTTSTPAGKHAKARAAAARRNELQPYTRDHPWARAGARVLDSPAWQVVSVAMTITALFALDFTFAFLPSEVDDSTYHIIFFAFCFLIVEMIAMSLIKANYFFGFFFWLDFIGTLSMVTDVPWLLGPEENTDDLTVARASRVSRIARSARSLVRLAAND